MTAAEIISEANRRGVVFAVRDGQIIARPAGALPLEVKAAVKERKIELLALLSGAHSDPRNDSDVRPGVYVDHVEAQRLARLDRERHDADKTIARGYDLDPTAPSHLEYQERQTRARLIEAAEEERRAGLVTCPPRAAAKSLIRTCREHGVGLHVESDGTLVVESNGHAWRSLVDAIEIHADDVAVLVASGWSDA